jgi:hypothetical protein
MKRSPCLRLELNVLLAPGTDTEQPDGNAHLLLEKAYVVVRCHRQVRRFGRAGDVG